MGCLLASVPQAEPLIGGTKYNALLNGVHVWTPPPVPMVAVSASVSSDYQPESQYPGTFDLVFGLGNNLPTAGSQQELLRWNNLATTQAGQKVSVTGQVPASLVQGNVVRTFVLPQANAYRRSLGQADPYAPYGVSVPIDATSIDYPNTWQFTYYPKVVYFQTNFVNEDSSNTWQPLQQIIMGVPTKVQVVYYPSTPVVYPDSSTPWTSQAFNVRDTENTYPYLTVLYMGDGSAYTEYASAPLPAAAQMTDQQVFTLTDIVNAPAAVTPYVFQFYFGLTVSTDMDLPFEFWFCIDQVQTELMFAPGSYVGGEGYSWYSQWYDSGDLEGKQIITQMYFNGGGYDIYDNFIFDMSLVTYGGYIYALNGAYIM